MLFFNEITFFPSLDYFQRADEDVFLGKQKRINQKKDHKISGQKMLLKIAFLTKLCTT